MSAVSSYTLLDFSDEIVDYQPDAILIYAGHNEYLGILGVGSVLAGGMARPVVLAYLQLRKLRTFQLLQRAYASVQGLFAQEIKKESDRTLMADLAASQHIPFGSTLYERGIHQFDANLNALLARYQKLGMPVFVGTLVSNERDQKPFISLLAPTTDATLWKQYYRNAAEALRRGDTARAAEALNAAIRLNSTAAETYYVKAQLLEKSGDHQAARQAYLAAKDRDQLRFRAPEQFNHVIREAATRHNATLVDVQDAFVSASRNGIVGNELMLEHLHPNLKGYFILADTLLSGPKGKTIDRFLGTYRSNCRGVAGRTRYRNRVSSWALYDKEIKSRLAVSDRSNETQDSRASKPRGTACSRTL